MKEVTEEQIKKDLLEKIENRDEAATRDLLNGIHPADIAELIRELDTEEAVFVISLLDEEAAADTLMELDEDDRHKLLEHIPNQDIARLFVQNLDTDDAVDLIQELDKEDQEEVLSHVDDVEQAGSIVDLLKYDEDTAGSLMGTEMIVVNENWSMPECIKRMREQAEEMDEIYYVYVVDDDNKLKGILPLKTLITHPSVSKIKHIMETEPISVKTDEPIDDIIISFEKYNLAVMPVVDSIGRLVGRITFDDVMDEAREQSDRDYQLASGLSKDVETRDTVLYQTKARLPWLLIGMIGGLASSLVLGGFDESFVTNPIMALFIPLIGGTGGNVGIQSSAIVVQGLANGTLDLKDSSVAIFKEIGIALINASIISLLVFLYNYFFFITGVEQSIMMSVAVSLSLFAVIMFAAIFGTLVPLLLEKVKIDPAIATGPFITITNDIIGMMIYMLVISYLLP